MASESNSPADLRAIPSSVSGDGTTFVKGLKKYLEKYDKNVDNKISNIGEGTVNQVTSLRLTEEHRTNASGNINDIRVEFDTVNVSDYAFAQIWLRKGTSGAWIQQGNTSGVQYVIEDVKTDSSNRYYVKVIACNNNAGYSDFDTAPVESILIRGSVYQCNTPTQFYWSREDNKWHWSGYTDNGYTDYFEIRTDQNAGVWNEHRLDSVPAGTYYSTKTPTTRSGTAYLYVRNVFGQYNSPAIHQFSLTAPAKPTKATLEVITDGVKVTLQALPSGCTNYVVDVDGVEYEVTNSTWTVYQFFGSISVKYCFVDSVGRGQWSDSNSITTGRYIEATEITDGAISTPKLAANAITAAKINVNDINTSSILANSIKGDRIKAGTLDASKITAGSIVVSSKESEDSGIVTIKDGAINGSKITAASIIGDKLAAKTVTATEIDTSTLVVGQNIDVLQGYIKVGGTKGNVTIENGAITAAMLSADAVSTKNITVSQMNNAINSGATTGARVVITSNLIEVYDGVNTLPRVKIGVW